MKKVLTKIFTFTFLGFIVTSCFDMPKEPTMPTWDVNVNVPLVGDSYTMADILDTSASDYLGILNTDGINDSLYFLLVDDISNTTKFQDSIKVPALVSPVTTHLVSPATGSQVSIGFVINPDDDYHLVAAKFSSGGFDFGITNNSPNSVSFTIYIPGFKLKTNPDSMLTFRATVNGNGTYQQHVEVSEFNYHELPVYEGAPLVPPYDYQNAKGFLVVLSANATNDVDLTLETSSTEMSVSYLEGRIKRTELTGISQEVETGLTSDIENFAQSIRLKNASFTLNVQTFGQMQNLAIVFENMRITGYMLDDNDNVTDSITLKLNGSETFTDSIVAGVPFQKIFSQENSNIVDFLLALPDRIKITNNIAIGPVGDDDQVVSAHDSVKVSASIYAPVIVSVSAASFDGEENIDLSDDDKDNLKDIKSAYAKLIVDNEIPAYAKVLAQVLDENGNKLFDFHDMNGNTVLTIAPADVDENGISVGPKRSELSVSLNENEIQQLIDHGNKIKFSVLAYTTGSDDDTFGHFVRIKSNYKISYKASVGGVYHLNLND